MGSSLSWLVTDKGEFSSLCEKLGLTQESDGTEGSIVGYRCDDGQLFMFETRNRGWTFADSNMRARLSAGREVLFGTLETHVMSSSYALWRNGMEVWDVFHSADEGEYHLSVLGDPPASLEEYKSQRFEKQKTAEGTVEGIDEVIEVPLDLSIELTGFHPEDEDHVPEGEYFSLFEPIRVTLWSRLFGSRDAIDLVWDLKFRFLRRRFGSKSVRAVLSCFSHERQEWVIKELHQTTDGDNTYIVIFADNQRLRRYRWGTYWKYHWSNGEVTELERDHPEAKNHLWGRWPRRTSRWRKIFGLRR